MTPGKNGKKRPLTVDHSTSIGTIVKRERFLVLDGESQGSIFMMKLGLGNKLMSDCFPSQTFNSTTSSYIRREEFDLLAPSIIDSIGLKFDGAPVWILGLHPIKVNTIFVPDFQSFSELLGHIEKCNVETSLFNKLVTLLGRRRFVFGQLGCPALVWLVSGTLQFLNEQFDTL